MHDFEYLEPATLIEACSMKAELGDDARVMAGCSALILALRQRMLSPTHLISLGNLPELKGISIDKARDLHIGALTLHSEIANSELIRKDWPIIAEMAGMLANPQVRNQGTIGGNLCYGDPATDPPTCLLAHDAFVVVQGLSQRRLVPIQDFLLDYFEVALEDDEIVVEVVIPASGYNGGCHTRFKRTAAEHRPMINLAVTLEKGNDNSCSDIRIALGASTPVPVRLIDAENQLRGQLVTKELIVAVAETASDKLEIIDDQRGSLEYRQAMISVVVQRTLWELFGFEAE